MLKLLHFHIAMVGVRLVRVIIDRIRSTGGNDFEVLIGTQGAEGGGGGRGRRGTGADARRAQSFVSYLIAGA